jgi:hypothetical protein
MNGNGDKKPPSHQEIDLDYLFKDFKTSNGRNVIVK